MLFRREYRAGPRDGTIKTREARCAGFGSVEAADVRKLKARGLTVSHETGCELTAPGARVLEQQ